MKIVPLFCFLFLLAGQSLASYSSNKYVDVVLALLSLKARDLITRYLPDYTFEYKDKTIFGEVGGEVEYSSGRLTGLYSVRRYHDCEDLRRTSANVTINCALTFEPLVATYEGKFKYGFLPKVNIHAKGVVPFILLDVEFSHSFDSYTTSNARVTALKVRTISRVKTEFSGLGPLNGHIKVLENNYRDRITSEIMDVINKRFRYALENAAYSLSMPLS